MALAIWRKKLLEEVVGSGASWWLCVAFRSKGIVWKLCRQYWWTGKYLDVHKFAVSF